MLTMEKGRALRFAVAVLLIGGLAAYVGVDGTVEVFRRLDPTYILWLALLSVVLIWISCVKWQLFLRAAGHEVKVLSLMRYYTMSYFFNMFMPSLLGGDVARSIQLGYRLQSFQKVFAATFIERFTGLLAMALIGVFFVAIRVRVTAGVEVAVLGVAIGSCFAALVLFSERCHQQFLRIARATGAHLPVAGERWRRLLEKASEITAFTRNRPGLVSRALLLSVVFHLLAVLNTYTAALAIGWHGVSFPALCIVVPLVLLVAAAPVTPSSIGVQEGAFVYFLTRIGASSAEGLAVALVLRAKNLITALVGGLLWICVRTEERSSIGEQHAPGPC